jgi:osmoprotectant transport system permease protein
MNLLDFLKEYDTSLLLALLQHLRLVAVAGIIAVAIALPTTLYIYRHQRSAGFVLGLANVIQTIPSIALFGLMIPILSLVNRGVGAVPAVIALVLYAQLPIIRNTWTALHAVPAEVIDAARGMGMTDRQIMRSLLLPLAAPGIISGIRLATVANIGVAAVAAFIGAGGLGLFIQRGINTTWTTMIVAGVIGIALLTLMAELLLEAIERAVVPKGVAIGRRREQ